MYKPQKKGKLKCFKSLLKDWWVGHLNKGSMKLPMLFFTYFSLTRGSKKFQIPLANRNSANRFAKSKTTSLTEK